MDNKNKIIENFYKTLELKGYKGKVVSGEHIPELRNDIKKHYEQNLFDPEFYKDYKSYFEIEQEYEFQVKSLFIISVPVPPFEAVFHWDNKEISLLIPPTYLYGRKIIDEMAELVNNILKPHGYKAAYAQLPQKTLAVRCGLAEYGRNNITYVDGIGSYHRLTTLYSDFPTTEDNWRELQMMDLCKECSACTNNCPTGAIPNDRFLLYVNRCLTYHNEQPPEVPFPDWIDSSWHNCLIGCLQCQKICPANKNVKDWTENGPEFNEEETKILLKGANFDDLHSETKEKIEKYDLVNYLEYLPRNISLFFK